MFKPGDIVSCTCGCRDNYIIVKQVNNDGYDYDIKYLDKPNNPAGYANHKDLKLIKSKLSQDFDNDLKDLLDE